VKRAGRWWQTRRGRSCGKLGPALADRDAVVLSDYGSGLVTPALASAVRARISTRARRRPVPVLLDSRYRLLDYRDLTICTPNESEVEQALDLRIDDDPGALERAGREILTRTRMRGVLITRGSRGWRSSTNATFRTRFG
jgi:bifunctional ADP-heptose synthase (sugar kinase/adenylyltransferase)